MLPAASEGAVSRAGEGRGGGVAKASLVELGEPLVLRDRGGPHRLVRFAPCSPGRTQLLRQLLLSPLARASARRRLASPGGVYV